MLKRCKLLCLTAVIGGLVSGCATLTPEMVQKKHAEWQSVVDRFERTQGLSCSQVPELYDISRLKVGSMVKTEFTGGKSKQLETKTLHDIKSTENEKRYIVNKKIRSNIFTLEGDPLAFSKVICSDKINYINYVSTGPDSILDAINKGGLLYPLTMWGMSKRVAQVFKEHKIETKILDFKLVSQEKLTIANQDVSCRVYQIQTITRETIPSINDSIRDGSGKVWISDDVPFGFVKSESNAVMYNSGFYFKIGQETSGETIFIGSSQCTGTSEVVEFKY